MNYFCDIDDHDVDNEIMIRNDTKSTLNDIKTLDLEIQQLQISHKLHIQKEDQGNIDMQVVNRCH